MSVRLIRCDHCGHAFQIDARHIGLVVECPNCDGSILIREAVKPPPPPPAAPPEPPTSTPPPAPTTPPPHQRADEARSPAEPISIESKPSAEAKPKRPLTRTELVAQRRRRHLWIAIGGAVILAAAAIALVKLGQPAGG